MTPVVCRVKHDPDNNEHGDCLRACIATIMDLDAEKVPHFLENYKGDPKTVNLRIRSFLAEHGYQPFWVNFPGDIARDMLLEIMGELNPHVHYILYGSTIEGDHVVVCRGGDVAHNPAWYASEIVGPTVSNGHWQIMVIAKA